MSLGTTHAFDRSERVREDDDAAALLEALRAREPWAERRFVAAHAGRLRALLARILGATGGVDDLVQEAFIRAFARFDRVSDPDALSAWMMAIGVHVGREALRSRRRRRWLLFWDDVAVEEPAQQAAADSSASEALRATYRVLAELSSESQLVFALRHIEGMEVSELAPLCGLSLATAKRRVRDAEEAFVRRARKTAELREWLERGSRWTTS